jgi:hypothetical protein
MGCSGERGGGRGEGGRSPWLYSGGGEKKRIVIGFREAAMASASPSVEPKSRRKEEGRKRRGVRMQIYTREREKGGNIRKRERGWWGGKRRGWLK